MSVYVCDAIMGSGKSSAAITYMNEHPEKKFIYITPYLDEASRISKACPGMEFFEPHRLSDFKGSKTLHTMDLVSRGLNVATTHQAFKFYPQELLDMVREQKYTLIIDENVDVLETISEDIGDVNMAIDAGYLVQREDGVFRLGEKQYEGATLRDFFRMLKSRDLAQVRADKTSYFLYWRLPPELITAFEDVFILTYLFVGQSLYYFLALNNIAYENIGIEHPAEHEYRFSKTGTYIPTYVHHLGDMINVCEHDKLNDIGKDYYALSCSWFKKRGDQVEQLKKNVYNYMRNIMSVPSSERMWSTFTESEYKVRGAGYSKGYVTFNAKATNNFRHKTTLAYCVNLFMHVGHKLYYHDNGIAVDEDAYALSNMVQWIWRSAIRDGKPINIYIPSKRMRDLLTAWIETTAKGGTCNDEHTKV